MIPLILDSLLKILREMVSYDFLNMNMNMNMNMTKNFWKGQRVLVTGASGFVGGWLIKDLLDKGAQVIAFAREWNPQCEFISSQDYKHTAIVDGALEDYLTIERAIVQHDASVVIHLAAQAIVGLGQRAPLQTFESNIRGTYNLLDACRVHRSGIKAIIVASSDKAYGESDQLPYVENQPLAGSRPYEVSKVCADLLAQSYYASYDLPIGIGRCGNIYGGGDLNWNRIVPGTIRSLLQGECPVIRSDGSFIRDYIYVKDVSAAFLCLAEAISFEAIAGEAFNFSSQKPITVSALVSEMQAIMNCTDLKPQILDSAEGEIHDQYLDSSKAQKLLGWQAQYQLSAALKETINWYSRLLCLQTQMPETINAK